MADPVRFQPVEDYDPPSLPTADTLQAMLGRLRSLVQGDASEPVIADDHLQRSTVAMLDRIAAPPACGPLIDELQNTLAEWLQSETPRLNHQLIVMPPCDEAGVLESWAARYGHSVLAAPSRDDLTSAHTNDLPSMAGDGVLVIPRLEDWFLRHRNGLARVRALLARLDRLDRRCVVGCNSWAWAFLCKSVQAHLVLPDGLSFQPFDARRLSDWFARLASDETLDAVSFRISDTGDDVFARADDGELLHDHFETLAARSRGIPWVAWHLWRRSLRARIDTAAGSAANAAGQSVACATDPVAGVTESGKHANEQVLWIVALEEFSLPGTNELADALLVLQALLIHGHLTAVQLAEVTPIVGESTVVSCLLRAGLVQLNDGQLSCTPAAYPAVRGGLLAAGFSMDAL